jgi:hypothetical protein
MPAPPIDRYTRCRAAGTTPLTMQPGYGSRHVNRLSHYRDPLTGVPLSPSAKGCDTLLVMGVFFPPVGIALRVRNVNEFLLSEVFGRR